MRTESLKVLQKFGLEGSNYKILVQAKSGNRYIVWYWSSLSVDVKQEVLVDFDNYNNWCSISNPQNGSKSTITKVNKVV